MESYPMPWWLVQAGHGVLTALAVTGLVTAKGPVAWLWLGVVMVALATARQARQHHPEEIEPIPEPVQPIETDQPSGW